MTVPAAERESNLSPASLPLVFEEDEEGSTKKKSLLSVIDTFAHIIFLSFKSASFYVFNMARDENNLNTSYQKRPFGTRIMLSSTYDCLMDHMVNFVDGNYSPDISDLFKTRYKVHFR